ncbi:hypothetical protein P5V43_21505 [Mycobacteroides abscessus subsp. bolletii]|uniref:hypothetical protein n=1 Tax=Mycobacteroides abscessus TaxID=36809 RepID=UPI00266BF8A4|nr:hypothetical protein [Mycobacteroides abscessus]MDO3129687.1 hypothetical protein [Mycobacteroides abscessus subsp. bolletii]
MSDLKKPTDPFSLIGDSWPSESESAYHKAKVVADDAATTASTQAQSARDAESRMADEQGKTASAVSSGYGAAASDLQEESITYTTISAWMTDAEGKIRSAKTSISDLVSVGTVEVRDALNSELSGTPATPSFNELIAQYRADIASVKTKLGVELDGIGHSLAGDQGASRTPSYTSVSTTPEHADPHASMASYTGTPGAPVPEPHQLPPMPRAASPSTTESPNATSTPSTPAAPHPVNPTLANLVGGQGAPTGTPSTGTSTPHTSSQGSPSPQAHQPTEQGQTPRPAGLPHIPSLPLPNIPAAAESVATVVSSAAGHPLPTAPSTITQGVPASTGFTPGVPGTSPMAPTPAPLTPIGGGGLSAPPVTQPVTPAPQAAPPASPQQTTTTPSPPRGPAADLSWIQRTYGLAPGIDLPKSETASFPALFIADLPEPEAHLHRVLATIRQEFEQCGWSQPLAVATIRRGFETLCVYVTADSVSIHPHGVLLPAGVIPLGEMPSAPVDCHLEGSLMVTEKLMALVPREWDVEAVLSTVPADENSQSTEQYQSLVEGGELLECKVSRGRVGVTADEAMSAFARAALGSAGCGDLDVESARVRAARWVGVQPVDYLGVMARYHLADAAECMASGNWAEAVYCSERYLSVVEPKSQVA